MICKAITELNEYNALVIPVEEGKGIVTELPAAVNEAVSLVEKTTSYEMGKITGGLNIPGMPGMGF